MKHSVNLSRSAAGDRRNAGKHLIEAMRAVGMTDAEIRAALEGAAPVPAAEASHEPGQGSVILSNPAAEHVGERSLTAE